MQRRLFLLGLSATLAASWTSVLAQEDEEAPQVDASAAPPSDAVQTHESEASPSDVDPNAPQPQAVPPNDLPPPIDDVPQAGSAPPPVIHATPIPPQPTVSCVSCAPPCPPPTCQPCGRSRRRLFGRRRCR